MIEGQNPKNNKLFIVCMISLVMALSLVAFSFYIFPHLIWQASYDVPEFIGELREWFKEGYGYPESKANWSVFLMFFIPGIIASIITYIITNIIDKTDDVEAAAVRTQQTTTDEPQESMGIALKVLFLVCVVFLVVFFAEWFFSATL